MKDILAKYFYGSVKFLFYAVRILFETLNDFFGLTCHFFLAIFEFIDWAARSSCQLLKANPGSFVIAFATLLLALATFWLGLETNGLKAADLGPNISVSDVDLLFLDSKGELLLRRRWKDEAPVPLLWEATKANLDKVIMRVKFANTGKRDGYVKLLNSEYWFYEFWSDSTVIDDYSASLQLVPGQGESAWLYPRNVYHWVYLYSTSASFPNSLRKGTGPFWDLEVQTFSTPALSPKDRLYFVIKCSFGKEEYVGINPMCKPVREPSRGTLEQKKILEEFKKIFPQLSF